MPVFPYYNLYNRKPPYFNNYRFNYIPNTNFTPPTPQVPHQSQPKQTPEPSPQENRLYSQNKDNDVWLDLFGIKLYFEDVLILSLLFFLYEEKVKDEGLFLALVLLLIS